MNRLLLSLIPLFLAACAAAPPQKDLALAAADTDTVCERETRTGSNFSKASCRTAEQRKADQEALTRQGESRRNITGIMTGK